MPLGASELRSLLDNFACAICRDVGDPITLVCGHLVCTDCIDQLAATSRVRCPLCRAPCAVLLRRATLLIDASAHKAIRLLRGALKRGQLTPRHADPLLHCAGCSSFTDNPFALPSGKNCCKRCRSAKTGRPLLPPCSRASSWAPEAKGSASDRAQQRSPRNAHCASNT